MEVTVQNQPASRTGSAWSWKSLLPSILTLWLLVVGAQAATVIEVGSTTATLLPNHRQIQLSVELNSPQDNTTRNRLIYNWACNRPVTFSSGDGTNLGNNIVATLSQAGDDYTFTVVVRDPLDRTVTPGSGATLPLDVAPFPTRAYVVRAAGEPGEGMTFASVFSGEQNEPPKVATFQSSIRDQFDNPMADPVSGGSFVYQKIWDYSPKPNASPTVHISQNGVVTVDHGEGVNVYQVIVTYQNTGAQPSSFTGSATLQTNQVKIMFKPEAAAGETGYLFDHGKQKLAAAVSGALDWGWNIDLSGEAMRYRYDLGNPGSTQMQRCFAMMQAKTYRRVSLTPEQVANGADVATIGSLDRDENGDPQVDQDLSSAEWTLFNLPDATYSMEIVTGDPLYYGQRIHLLVTSDGGYIAPVVNGTTTSDNRWITTPAYGRMSGNMVIRNGTMGTRNVINSISLRKDINVPPAPISN